MLTNTPLNRDTLFQIVETSVDAIVVINHRGIMEYVNQATLQMFQYKKEEMLGQNVSILMPKPNATNHDKYINDYLHTRKAKIIGIGREVISLKKDGTTFSCLLSISEVKTKEAHLFIGIIHDISALKEAETKLKDINKHLEARVEERTEQLNEAVNKLLNINTALKNENTLRKKTETALKKSEEELKESLSKEKELNELKSRFVSMASHEFRTPLSTILSSANLIEKYAEKGEETIKINKHTSRIIKAVTHLNEVLSDFLMLGKWEEGKIKLEISSFTWKDLTKELLDIVEINLKNGQELQFEELDIIFKTDYNLLKNALINILSNAIKYSKENTTISVGIATTNNGIATIAVKDQGMGIPNHETEQIFERFYRATNIGAIDGTGLGLSIVKMYVEKLQGNIFVVSEINKGSTFSLQIPLQL